MSFWYSSSYPHCLERYFGLWLVWMPARCSGNFVGNPAIYSDGLMELCWIEVFGGAKEWTMM
ncbi:hypothetical protein MA16_Dca015928 [Dendrobium catenatum]|uniref:Uncharacterized protein n=1 Tax=Dendrobium catenatum TaxID=906689 RepID=A0A2I0VP77_9ASPA|nr:hypothetical protein MA16_Dca015928 [Dendrobium catenatum]